LVWHQCANTKFDGECAEYTLVQRRNGTVDPAVTGAFANGTWSGQLTPGAMGSGVTLQVQSGTITSASNAFSITGPPTLGVSSASLVAIGSRGGPFTPLSQTWTLTNTGNASLTWTAATGVPWLTIVPASGTLASGASIPVTATINAGAAALASGHYTDNVTFANTTNGNGDTTRAADLTVNPVPELTVTPATGFAPTGPVGGPFTPASTTWTLTNTGDAPLTWASAKTQGWLVLNSAGGTLDVGAGATVTATLDSSANALIANVYNDTITFTNSTNGRGNTTQSVVLSVHPPAPVLAAEPPVTGGTGNTITWNGVLGATAYEAQAADNLAFANALSSGWINVRSWTFTPLAAGKTWHFRARARTNIPSVLSSWTQTSQADFAADTAVNLSTTISPGNVVMLPGTIGYADDFDEAGTTWSSTLFPNVSAGTFERVALTGTGPNTTPALPINQGGDLEARLSGTKPSALMADVPANRFADGGIEAYIAPGNQNNLHYSGLLLRASRSGGVLNGYAAIFLFFANGTVKVDFTRIVNGNDNGTTNWFYSDTTPFALGANENIRARFSISGSTLTLTLWRVAIAYGEVTETAIPFYQNGNVLTATDTTYAAAGLAGSTIPSQTSASRCSTTCWSLCPIWVFPVAALSCRHSLPRIP
jgi:hypothetical protein